jgi:hypothetical protein
MKLTRVENRCDHGFLVDAKLCPECHGGDAVRDEAKITNEILAPGLVVGGSTISRLLGESTIEMRCGCGELFVTTRTVLYKVRNRNSRSCCAKCRRAKPHGLVGTYVCIVCRKEKPKAAFYACRTHSLGHQTRCKVCDNSKRGRARADVVGEELAT